MILSYIIFNNSLMDYGKSLIIIIIGIVVIILLRRILLPRIQKAAEKTKLAIDNFIIINIKKQLLPVLYFTVLYLSIQHLVIHNKIIYITKIIGLLIIIIYATRFFIALTVFLIRQYYAKNDDSVQQTSVLSALKKVITIIFWSIALIIFLDNIGIKITGLVAGLGISGVAVAFAAQAVLKDIFSYFSIFLDKPFELGDFIIIDNYMGTVEYIGIKTTRIKSLSGEQLIFANADLTNSRVRNYKRMQERRVSFNIGVIYETPVSVLKEIPGIIKNIIEETDNTRFDRSHFSGFGDSNLVYETVYYINTNDYNVYMDIQQYINLHIKEEFEKRNIQFAYPTQLLYVHKKK